MARAGYATDADPATGRAEQDPEAWWGAIGLAVRELVRLDVGEVCAIGIDGHGPTLVAVDATGRADPPRDHLAGHPLHRRSRRSSRPRPASRAGASAGLPAALWLERHEPAAAAATRWYLATWDSSRSA